MLSSRSAMSRTHCITSIFVLHHKYAEPGENKVSYFYSRWALALKPRGQRFFSEAIQLGLYQSSTAYKPDLAFRQLIKYLGRSELQACTATFHLISDFREIYSTVRSLPCLEITLSSISPLHINPQSFGAWEHFIHRNFKFKYQIKNCLNISQKALHGYIRDVK